jgi:hypothetical protein
VSVSVSVCLCVSSNSSFTNQATLVLINNDRTRNIILYESFLVCFVCILFHGKELPWKIIVFSTPAVSENTLLKFDSKDLELTTFAIMNSASP